MQLRTGGVEFRDMLSELRATSDKGRRDQRGVVRT
ncbi:hypothetical protein DFO70_10669 [Cytobacillus firmus]|uniref:Uncharacterized protein n=2 Tax=Cytobacillus TaxID=2675230 RepID=A0A366JW12_CYTFI|nr:hypothetical protein DFO70_10669 [Cytobacillus firmus]TDX42542.1 hypothetical protein DFO72_10669 [Cytobacillus oceanisediminis]